jgi:phosphatidate cytidylyltransferase
MSPQAIFLTALFSVLLIGSAVRLALIWLRPAAQGTTRIASLRTWWILAAGLALAIVSGLAGVCILMAVASWLGLSEYRRFVGRQESARIASAMLFLTIPLVYCAIYLGSGQIVLAFLPLASTLLVAGTEIVSGDTTDYIRTTGALVFGEVLLIFALGHAAQLAALPSTAQAPLGGVGWFLYLVLLTESNDIAQALVGRRWGRHKITPKVSPNKSLEGFLGGVGVTLALAVLLAPLLTTLHEQPVPVPLPEGTARFFWPALSGVLIACSGFLGDLNLSAIKRNVGVKDSGDLLPGMGGALDRLDSLTLTAPTFYYLIALPAL